MEKIYKACADATRRRIMKLLRERDMTAGEIAENFHLTKPTLSNHFSVLREAGLVTDLKTGRNVTYHLNAEVLEKALLSLMEDYDFVWVPVGDIAEVASELIDNLVREQFELVSRDFDSSMSGALPPEKLREVWGSTLEQWGPFVKQLSSRTERFWQYTAVTVACELARAVMDIRVTFSRTGKISGLWILNSEGEAERH